MEKTIQSIDMHMNQIVPSIDRLSDFPDDVICHILSFLPTKFSVSTSILARRRRFLWAYVPNLDFGRSDFSIKAEYSDIIHRVMLLHKVKSMTTFRLSHIYSDKYHLETWIAIAIERNVQNIDLNNVVRLPRCLFTCKTLVDLRLKNCRSIPSSGDVSLPSLKKLHLYFVEYEVDKTLSHLLSGCPVLEELIIDENFIMDERYIIDGKLDCFNISSPTLKRLTVDFPFNLDFKVKINAPALTYLQVYDCSCVYIIVSPMPSLIEADICVNNCSLKEDDVVKFLCCLGNVKCLTLSSHYKIPSQFPEFELKLDIDWRSLIKLLEIAVNLEVLTVDVDVSYWVEPKQVQTCLLLHLRTIRIHQMGCEEHEFNMIRYFLRNAKVLKRMEIYSQDNEIDFKANFDALQRISLFERGSEACQVAFY